MPSQSVPGFSTIVDPQGRPYAMPMAAPLYARTSDDDRLRPRPRNHFGDYIDLLSPRRYQELVSESRALASIGQPASLLEQKADYVAASHFRPQFKGKDAAYGSAALPLLEESLKICNLRGYLYDWKTTWRLMVPGMATDGRIWVLLTEWGDTGWPALQILEGHRIGQRDYSVTTVGKDDALTVITAADGSTKKVRGAYRDLRITQGIIYNAQGTEVAYRVLGADPKGADDMDISARDLFPIARPRSFSEGRTAPEIAAAAMDFIALNLAWEAQLDQQIIDSRLTLIEKTTTGKYDAGASFGGSPGSPATATPAGTPTTIDERGMTRIIKTGHALEAHETTRPSDQWMNFQSTGQARSATAIRWSTNMLNPANLSGAANRAFQDQVNTLIQDCFGTVAKGAERALNYFAAKLSGAPLNVLPVHAETMAWGIAPPPWFEVDRASAKYDLDDVAAGRTSMSTLHARDGASTAEVYVSRARAYQEAVQVRKQFPDVPLEVILGDLGVTVQRTGAFGGGQQSAVSSQPSKP